MLDVVKLSSARFWATSHFIQFAVCFFVSTIKEEESQFYLQDLMQTIQSCPVLGSKEFQFANSVSGKSLKEKWRESSTV